MGVWSLGWTRGWTRGWMDRRNGWKAKRRGDSGDPAAGRGTFRDPFWPFRARRRAAARARPLFKPMIFGPRATIFSIQDTNRPPPNPFGPLHPPSSDSTRGRLDEEPFPATSAEWFYDFMLHFGRFADIFYFSLEDTAEKNFLNFSTPPVGFGRAITPVCLLDAIRFHERNGCHTMPTCRA